MDQPSRKVLDEEIRAIRNDVAQLGARVEQALGRAFEAFGTNDAALAQSVFEDDEVIEILHQHLEVEINKTMSTQQPMVRDLRELTGALLIANELDRMRDYSERIAAQVINRVGPPGTNDLTMVTTMRDKTVTMIHEVMAAYNTNNPDQARAAAEANTRLDALYKQLFDEIVTGMGEGQLTLQQGTYQMWVAQYLERISSRVVSIAERVIYISTGAARAIRSRGRQRSEPTP